MNSVVKDIKVVFVRGIPGSGKTTYCSKLELESKNSNWKINTHLLSLDEALLNSHKKIGFDPRSTDKFIINLKKKFLDKIYEITHDSSIYHFMVVDVGTFSFKDICFFIGYSELSDITNIEIHTLKIKPEFCVKLTDLNITLSRLVALNKKLVEESNLIDSFYKEIHHVIINEQEDDDQC